MANFGLDFDHESRPDYNAAPDPQPKSKARLMMRSTRLYSILLVSLFIPAALSAQVFDSGPSISAQFTTVLNLPGDALPAAVNNVVTVGGVAGETTQVNIPSGAAITGVFLDARDGAEVNVSGGIVGSGFNALLGSEVNVSDGFLGNSFGVSGSELNISGGSVANTFFALNDSVVNITGGTVGDMFSAQNSVINLSDGDLGNSGFALDGSEFNISGGTVGLFFSAASGSEVNISAGSVSDGFDAQSGSVVNISGGSVGTFLNAEGGSQVNISGGSVGTFLNAESGSQINISGGEVGDGFLAVAGSNVNVFGTAFVLNGVLLDNLVEGQAFTIVERDVPLIGQHADGSTFSFILNSTPQAFADGFEFGATLTVTLVPELEVLLGDVDRNGVIDFSDIGPFIAVLAANGDQAEADTNEDGLVDFSDIGMFISLLSSF